MINTTSQTTLKEAYNYLVYTGLVKNQKRLADIMGSYPACVSNAINGNPKYLTPRFIKRFNSAFNGLFNERWLLYGEGEMLAKPQGSTIINSNNNNTYAEGASGKGNITINHQGGGSISQMQGANNIALRPLVTKSLASKPNTDVYMVVKEEGKKMEQLIAFQQYSDFDFYYQVRQDAMIPLYGQGDVLALAHLEFETFIIQGAAMVIDTKDFGFLLRNVYDRGDYYECRCVNQDSKFETQNIPKSNVIRLYRVVYSVRLGD